VRRFHSREKAGFGDSLTLFLNGKVVKFTAGVRHALSAFFLGKNTNPAADGFGSSLIVASDHDNANTSLQINSNPKQN
jgi:hypothetical protein